MSKRISLRKILINIFIFAITILCLFIVYSIHSYAGQEHTGSSGRQIWDLIWRAINFFILIGILIYLLKTPVRNFINQRQQGIRESLEKAQEAREEARRRYQEMEEKLAKASHEIEEITRMIKEQGDAEKRRILENAEKESQRIKQQAQFMAEQEVKKARALLRKEAVDLAVEMAESLLKERLTENDKMRLVEEYIEKVVKAV
jgi:F-type H+-transporting ATPase subunit b